MKKILTLLFVLFIGVALTGCNGKDDDKELFDYDIITKLPDDQIEITVWHSFGEEKGAIIQEYIDEFEAEYTNISVNFTQEGNNYDELRNKVVNNIRTATTPTLVFTYPDHVADYIEGKAALALDPFINDDKVGLSKDEIADFIPAYMAENKQTGHYMGLPFNKSTEVLIYNKTYFDAQKGKTGFTKLTEMYNKLNPADSGDMEVVTWDLIKAVAQEIKADTALKDVKGLFPFAYDSNANLFITLIRQFGGKYTNSKGDLLFNNDKAIAAFEMYKAMHDAGLATIPIEWEQDYASTPFTQAQPQVYMTVGSTAGITYNVPKDKDGNATGEIGVAPIPQYDLENKQVIQQGTNITLMANSTDAERLAGWLLIKHLTSKEVTADWSMKTGYLPVRQSALDSDEYQEFLSLTDKNHDFYYESLAARAAYLQVDYMYYDPAFPGSSDVRSKADTTIQAILFGDKTIEQYLEDAIDDLDW